MAILYDIENEGAESVEFRESITLENVNFSYDGKNMVLRDISQQGNPHASRREGNPAQRRAEAENRNRGLFIVTPRF